MFSGNSCVENQAVEMSRKLAIITARGGSKRIPRKNVKPFLGRPIVEYSIAAAIDSRCFDFVMVSTDDEEIASLAQSFGAQVPFLRSKETSSDFATTAAVVAEVIARLAERGKIFEDICCIYPTAPFITGANIRKAYERLIESGASSLISIVRFDYPIQRALRINGSSVSFWLPEFGNSRSQDIETMYHDAGQMYWLHGDAFLNQCSFMTGNTIGFELPATEVQDIDTESDWTIAELKYKLMIHATSSD